MKFIDKIVSLIYPMKCSVCKKPSNISRCLCEQCERELMAQLINIPVCDICAAPKGQCNCKDVQPVFLGCVSPFFYNQLAKALIIDGKFFGNKMACEYFAMYIGTGVVSKKWQFDEIAYVPMSKAHQGERGYNQCEVIASELASLLEKPINKKALKKIKNNKTQHELNAAERAENVKNVFEADHSSVNGKTILLIDDIKTTGHTLNECARALLAAGAKGVYCATATITL